MNARHIVATTITLFSVAAAAGAGAAELKQLPVSGDWVDVCDISGVRTISAPQSPQLPPGFPAPPSSPTLIEVSFNSSHPVLINIPKGEDASAIKEKIARMRESTACKSSDKK